MKQNIMQLLYFYLDACVRPLFVICFVLIAFVSTAQTIQPAAERTEAYLEKIKDKDIAIVANQTSTIHQTHLVDSLLSLGIKVKHIFSPEHGFRGNEDAGKLVANGIDITTGLPIISLYGKKKKPKKEDLEGIEVVLFDIQDVGVRFYTYLSSLHYVMEACAEENVLLIVLDRPNPNAHSINGPILDSKFQSFVGMHPIPVVYGCTLGEMAHMINGEKWLNHGVQCPLEVIKCGNYQHNSCYTLPIKPSPNLPNALSIALYPSLCFFEATDISIGRGTNTPFQIIGSPLLKDSSFSFTPVSMPGASKYPKHENKKCYGSNLRDRNDDTHFSLRYLLSYYKAYPNKEKFFTNEKFFNLLAGNDILIKQIKDEVSEVDIKKSWEKDLTRYMLMRKKYLLYGL